MSKVKDMITELFPSTKNINEVVVVIEKYKDKFGLGTDLKLGEAMISIVSTLIDIAINNAYRERQSMIEFLYGAYAGKKDQGE